MRKMMFTIAALLTTMGINLHAQNIDSLQRQDSIRRERDTAVVECSRSELYTNKAADLVQFNGAKTREISYADAGKAIDYVLKAIHINSKYSDVYALRNNYDCLGYAYFVQKKYAQAKWFILQSKSISRYRNDVPAMINSLMQLASIKLAIKDYKMAEKDFNTAITLTKTRKDIARQIEIEKCLATLYSNSGKAKAALAMEKHSELLQNNLEKYTLQQAKLKQVKEQKYYAMLKAKAKKHAVTAENKPSTTVAVPEQTADEGNKTEVQTAITIAAGDK